MPGRTPTRVPRNTPTSAQRRFSGVRATPNPSISELIESMRAAFVRVAVYVPGPSSLSGQDVREDAVRQADAEPAIEDQEDDDPEHEPDQDVQHVPLAAHGVGRDREHQR